MKNPRHLEISKTYLLRTFFPDGGEKPVSDWILVKWTGKSLVDSDGMTWTEWIDKDFSDIFEEE